jgi:hypothetical protein
MKKNIVFSTGMLWSKKQFLINSKNLDSWSSMWSGATAHTRAWNFFSMDSLWTIDSFVNWANNLENPYNFKEEENK